MTLAFAGAMALVLGVTGLVLQLRFGDELDRTVDQGLRSRAEDVRALVRQADTGLAEAGRSSLTPRGETFAEIVRRNGHVLDATPALHSRPLLTGAELRRAQGGAVQIDRRAIPALPDDARLMAVPVRAQGQHLVIVVGASLNERDRALTDLRRLLLLGGPATLLFASLAGYLVAGLALRGVEAMRARAERMSVAQPGDRLPVPRAGDELARLGATLNAMLARNEAAFARERAFISDASHELRTPLAVLKADVEIALRGSRSRQELRTTLTSVAEETDRLAGMAEDLLLLARADEGRLAAAPVPTSVAETFARLTERFRQRARSAGRTIVVCPPGDLRVLADPPRLEQALTNLVDNALRHGGGDVTLHAEKAEGRARSPDFVELHVTDQGAGFLPRFLPRAFERFSRPADARADDGTGLGLGIVQAIARAYGGDAAAANRPGGGADVWLTLPRAEEARPGSSRSSDERERSPS